MQRRFVQPYCIFFRRTSSETAVSAHGDQTGTVREFPLSGTLYDFFSLRTGSTYYFYYVYPLVDLIEVIPIHRNT